MLILHNISFTGIMGYRLKFEIDCYGVWKNSSEWLSSKYFCKLCFIMASNMVITNKYEVLYELQLLNSVCWILPCFIILMTLLLMMIFVIALSFKLEHFLRYCAQSNFPFLLCYSNYKY